MNSHGKRLRGLFLAAALAALAAGYVMVGPQEARAATFTVNNTGDGADFALDGICETASGNGQCTLRAAIMESNSVIGTDTISFNIGAGTPKIAPLAVLPDVVDKVTIDGDTGGATRVELSGENIAGFTTGLTIKGSGTVLDHLVVNRWFRGVRLDGSGTHLVTQSYIGTDAAGTTSLANTDAGIYVNSSSNVVTNNVISGNNEAIVVEFGALSSIISNNNIGTDPAGTTGVPNGPSARGAVVVGGDFTQVTDNLISGNNGTGLYLTADKVLVDKNKIGTNATGLAALGNTGYGVFVYDEDDSEIGTSSGNVISGNGSGGVGFGSLVGTGNVVRRNIIGLAVNGDTPIPNAVGIDIPSSSTGIVTIGGSTSLDANFISGNTGNGITVANASTIMQNRIGTDATGLLARGNGSAGVDASGGAAIGAVGSGNVISGNAGPGVRLGGTANLVSNLIGVGSDGTTAVPNGKIFKLLAVGAPGVDVTTSNHIIGGPTLASGNLIAHNRSNGVQVCSTCTNVGVFNNTAHSNGGLAMDLLTGASSSYLSYGNTANDLGDADTGANGLQNHPVISSAETVGGVTTIKASLNSTPSTSFVVGFYKNVTCDSLVHGEAETLIGSLVVSTDVSGNTGSFSFSPASPVPAGQFVVAGAVTQVSPFNTSELSECATVGSGCLSDVDCDGFKDVALLNHVGLFNLNVSFDNCLVFANGPQANTDGNFLDTTPPLGQDDKTILRSDAAGDACDDDDDNDYIPDALEVQVGGWCSGTTSYVTNPLSADTDGDRYTDYAECIVGTDPTLAATKPTAAQCAAALGISTSVDFDGDKIKDYIEFCNYSGSPFLTDTDADKALDGAKDGCEVVSFNGDRIVNVADMGMLAAAIANVSLRHVNLDVNKDGFYNPADSGFVSSFISPSGQCPG